MADTSLYGQATIHMCGFVKVCIWHLCQRTEVLVTWLQKYICVVFKGLSAVILQLDADSYIIYDPTKVTLHKVKSLA